MPSGPPVSSSFCHIPASFPRSSRERSATERLTIDRLLPSFASPMAILWIRSSPSRTVALSIDAVMTPGGAGGPAAVSTSRATERSTTTPLSSAMRALTSGRFIQRWACIRFDACV